MWLTNKTCRHLLEEVLVETTSCVFKIFQHSFLRVCEGKPGPIEDASGFIRLQNILRIPLKYPHLLLDGFFFFF